MWRSTSDLDVRYWTAHYTNKAHLCDAACGFGIPAGVQADATQWSSDPHVTGGDFDLSLCKPRLFD